MADNERMSGGYTPSDDREAAMVNAIIKGIDTSLSSVTNELKKLNAELKSFTDDYDKRTPSESERRSMKSRDIDALRRSLPTITKDLKEFQSNLRDAKRSATENRRRWSDESARSSYRSMGSDVVSARRMKTLAQRYENEIKRILDDAEREFERDQELHKKKMEELKAQTKVKEVEFAFKSREIHDKIEGLKDSKGTAKGGEASKIDVEIARLEKELKKYQDAAEKARNDEAFELQRFESDMSSRQEDISKETEKVTKEYKDSVEDVRKTFADLEDLIERSRDGANSFKGVSKSFSYFMEHDIEKDKDDIFMQNRDKLLRSIIEASNAIDEKLNDRDELNEQEEKNLKAQQLLYKKQIEYLRTLTPLTDIWRDAANNIKEVGRNILKSGIKSLAKNLENRYLTSYVEGFQRVYDSIESTRNSISARLKLDQGGYEDLQNAIYAQIKERGMEGTVSLTDIDDMITALSASGITDQAMLQELAIEGARLKAGGSSINLGNEEMLQQLMLMYNNSIRQGNSQEYALKEITNLMESVADSEILTRENLGSDTALVNGGIDTAIIQALKYGVSAGRSGADLTKDVQSSIYAAQAQYSAGIDAATIQQAVQAIWGGDVNSLDTFGKILYGSGKLTRTNIDEWGMEKSMQYVADNLVDILSSAPEEYFNEYTSAYGLPGSKEGLRTLKQQGSLNVTLDDDALERMAEISEERQSAYSTGEYYSKTWQVNKKAENSTTKAAIAAEKMYKGDSVISDQLNNINNTLSSIVDILIDAGFESFKSSSVGNAVGSMAGSIVGSEFVGGASGLAGAGAAAAVGTVATVLAYNFIGKPWQESIENGLSSFETATNEITEKSMEGMDAAQAQIDAANTMLSTFQDMSLTEKKQLLLQKQNLSLNGKILDKQELLNLDDETIQELFKDNVIKEQENILAQAEALKKESEFRNLNASQLASLEEIFGSSDYGAENINRFIGALGGAQSMSDFYNLLGGAELTTETGAKKFVSFSDMSDTELKQYAMQQGKSSTWVEGRSKDQIVAELQQARLQEFGEQSGWSESTTGVASSVIRDIENRKTIHEKAVSTLRRKWNTLVEEQGLQDAPFRDILATYAIKYLTDGYDSSHIILGEDGLPTLDNNGGIYYDASAYKEGKMFRSGLTNVPYDQYPAILHKGERVLTAEEADAYNELSSFAVSQLSSTTNTYESPYRVFNTTQYGSDSSDIKQSIDTQTTSVQNMLSEILGAINNLCRILQTPSTNSLAKQNVLRMNTNITQLNTL